MLRRCSFLDVGSLANADISVCKRILTMKKMRMTKKFGSFYMRKRFYRDEVRYGTYLLSCFYSMQD